MSKPSLNRISDIQCSQTRKRCRNASIFSVSSLSSRTANTYWSDPKW